MHDPRGVVVKHIDVQEKAQASLPAAERKESDMINARIDADRRRHIELMGRRK